MKRTLWVALAAMALSACSKVPAGNVGVKVYLLGSSSGVDSEELGPGRYWIGFNEDLFLFPTFTQNYTWTREPDESGDAADESITFQTVEGLSVNADIGISYRIDPTKVNTVFQKYRRGVSEITDTFLRNMVRDALVEASSDQPVEYVYGAGKAALMDEVQETVTSQVSDIGIIVEKIYWIGDLRLPSNVTAAINAKIQATQMAQQRENEVAQARAEANKVIEEARGVAESSLTRARADAQAIELRGNAEAAAIKARGDALRANSDLVQLQAVEKWDGKLPTSIVPGSALPFVQIPVGNLDR